MIRYYPNPEGASPMKKTTPKKRPYQKPDILNRGQLKRFAGSPLGKLPGNPLNLPGKD